MAAGNDGRIDTVVVVVTGRTVVGGAVLVGVGVGMVTTEVGGGGLKTTSGLVAVVAGAGAVVVATVGCGTGAGAVVAVVVTAAAAVDVVEAMLEVVDEPGASRPLMVTVDGKPETGGCGGGLVTVADGMRRDPSRETAATRITTTTAPTPRPRSRFARATGSRDCHQPRIRSSAGGRPNAAFLPMDDHER